MSGKETSSYKGESILSSQFISRVYLDEEVKAARRITSIAREQRWINAVSGVPFPIYIPGVLIRVTIAVIKHHVGRKGFI